MVDFEKSIKIMEALEANANDLKKVSDVYKELRIFQSDIDSTRQLLESSIQELKDVGANNRELQTHLQELIDSTQNKMQEMRDLSSEQFLALTQENKAHQAEIKSSLVNNTQEAMENAYKFQRELDGSIFSRLERHKSDIEVEIRGQLVQVERVLTGTLTSSFNNMEAKVAERIAKLEKKVFTLSLLSGASLLGLVALAVILIKL